MGNEPSEEDVQDFENQYGIRLPEDFREFTMSSLEVSLWKSEKSYGQEPRLTM